MALPTDMLKFRYPWRPYQQRVLDAVKVHLRDEKLHIVAAPGSGKTILGLETFRLLGKPAVILTPTRTIRNQWLARLRMFVPEGSNETFDWASNDLHNPGFLTSITYQALHTQYREQLEEDSDDPVGDSPSAGDLDQMIATFKEIGVGTLILDEAHHLRQAWWKALTKFVKAIDGLTLVCLTATPPYDSVGSEWRRYEELCGPIDEEISVPELVKTGTLCPHQDYVYAVEADDKAAGEVRSYDLTLKSAFAELAADEVLQDAIRSHPWVNSTAPDPAEVLEEPELAVAMIVYLKMSSGAPPPALMAIMDMEMMDVPYPAKRWWQVLIRHYLFGATWAESKEREDHRDALAKRLRKEGLLYRRELRLEESRPVRESLSTSPNKIEACLRIHELERQLRGDSLRQVILTDFIRDDDVDDPQANGVLKLGAWTIFRALAGGPRSGPDMGLVTGRLVVVHRDAVAALQQVLGTDASKLRTEPVPSLPNFVRLSGPPLVDAMTELLNSGVLHVMVGTRALLGEGWDCPAINSLVLASYVGSFMLTNQMRGRAIRIDPKTPDKASSIWHIVAIVDGTESGLSDHQDLERRFKTFVGLAAEEASIISGLDRLGMPTPSAAKWSEGIRADMESRVSGFGELRRRWDDAIEAGGDGRVMPSVLTEKPPSIRPFHFRNTLKRLLATAFTMFMGGFVSIMQGEHDLENWRFILLLLLIASVVGFLVALPMLIRAAWLLIRFLPVDGSLRQISLALLDALCQTDVIQSPRQRLEIKIRELGEGGFSIGLKGATFYEQSVFADSLEQALGAIGNPRYMVTRTGTGLRKHNIDYHAVPDLLGIRKDRAEVFFAEWQRRIGKSTLIYCRNPEGRAALLKARSRSFSSNFADDVERLDCWQ